MKTSFLNKNTSYWINDLTILLSCPICKIDLPHKNTRLLREVFLVDIYCTECKNTFINLWRMYKGPDYDEYPEMYFIKSYDNDEYYATYFEDYLKEHSYVD